jgi:hypothetical protein
MTSSPIGRVIAAAFTSGDPSAEPLTRKLTETYLRPGCAATTRTAIDLVWQGALRRD